MAFAHEFWVWVIMIEVQMDVLGVGECVGVREKTQSLHTLRYI
jgi:hypothetical protein